MNFHDFSRVVIPIFVAKTPICEKKIWQVTSRVDKATDEKVQAALKRLPEGTTLLVVSHRLVTGWWFKFAGNQTTAKTRRFSPQQLVGGFISFLCSTFKKCDDDHHWEQLTRLFFWKSRCEFLAQWPQIFAISTSIFFRNHQIFNSCIRFSGARPRASRASHFFFSTGWFFQFCSTGAL